MCYASCWNFCFFPHDTVWVWVGIGLIVALGLWVECAHAAPKWENAPELFSTNPPIVLERETFIPPPWTTNSSCMITYYFDLSGGARELAITYWSLSSAFDNEKWSNYARAWESESPGSSLFASRISRTKRRQWVRFARAHFCGGNVVNFNVNFLSKYCLIFPTALAS